MLDKHAEISGECVRGNQTLIRVWLFQADP